MQRIPEAGNVRCVWPAGRLLGEGVWWSVAEQAVFWVDIKRPAILRFRPSDGARDEWPAPEPVGCCAPRARGGFIAALATGIYDMQLNEAGAQIMLRPLAVPSELGRSDRFNDGNCDLGGAFWAGTMDDAEKQTRGWFYRLDPSGRLDRMAGPYMVCNGPCFSPDGQWAYLTDSARRLLYRLDLTQEGAKPKRFLQLDEKDGYPDGMTTDREGRLWIACWDGAKVICVADTGERAAEISLPVSRPTRCAFGGPDLTTLYVSTASIGLARERLEAEPFAGGLLAVSLKGAAGWPAPAFAG